jgi:serine/threonine protein kinase
LQRFVIFGISKRLNFGRPSWLAFRKKPQQGWDEMSPPPNPPLRDDQSGEEALNLTPSPLPESGEEPQVASTQSHLTPEVVTDRPTLTSITPGDSGLPTSKVAGSLVGLTIDDYDLLEEIGRGGMGIVYKARQKSLDRLVAIKTLLASHFAHPAILQRFLGEAKAAAGINHPNIVRVYQVGECPAGHFFAMEFIEGRTLKEIIQERTAPISWSVALMIVVAEAIHHAHQQGIVHRDLKPSNIMIDQFRRPVVMDFGLAKYIDRPSTITQLGVIVGTPAYMSPEQAGEEITEIGPTSDIYSMGAILYTLLTGRPPFSEKTSLKTVMKVASSAMPPPPSQIRKDVPLQLDEICMKCLSKDPAGRFTNAQVLADELSHFRNQLKQKSSSLSYRQTLPAVILIAEKTGKRVRLYNELNVIGRSSECDVVIRASDISKRHCQIILETERVILEDLNSVNGTLVNGERVSLVELLNGDQLTIGGHVFHVRVKKGKE